MLIRVAALAAALAAVALGTASGASAQTYTDSISGYEYYATSTDGKFAGTASGPLPGTWNADVQHTPLCLSCKPTATITAGSFSLDTVIGYVPTVVSGTFTGGTVQWTNPTTGCANQTFAVNGDLTNGTFSATLTHYRHSVFGYCVTYAASVSGTVTVNI
jgi:hypothetical protein